jgi:citrate lyase beta subunit
VLQAATEISADSIVMDCEDGVALSMKDVARGEAQGAGSWDSMLNQGS